MGACCSKDTAHARRCRRRRRRGRDRGPACLEEDEGRELYGEADDDEEDDGSRTGPGGARVRFKGSCQLATMHSQQGWKGVNQDAMTVWEDFGGQKDAIYCGVFDGHGPFGHKVSSHVRDALPFKLSSSLDHSDHGDTGDDRDGESGSDQWLSFWTTASVKAFEELDKELSQQQAIDCICSGTTAVSLIKQREHLIIANLGDSRAILCCRDDKDRPTPIQLTVDLKPNIPSEAERIRSCKGRVFAHEEEPDVHRIWLPDEDSPGLAMARAFGDFCLKDFGLISTPLVSYRKLTEKDEFVILATDGVWDVLSNKEVVKIVSSASKRSEAAKNLVDRAVKAWRSKFPTSKVDDCAAICLFLKDPPSSTMPALDSRKHSRRSRQMSIESFMTARSESYNTAIGEDISVSDITASSKEEWSALEGLSRVNSLLRLPRFASMLSWRKKSVKINEDET